MRGGALFNGKEGRGDFRKKLFNGKEGRGDFRKKSLSLQERRRGRKNPFFTSKKKLPLASIPIPTRRSK